MLSRAMDDALTTDAQTLLGEGDMNSRTPKPQLQRSPLNNIPGAHLVRVRVGMLPLNQGHK